MNGLRVIDDQLPLVEVVVPSGEVVRLAPAVLTDSAADELARVVRDALGSGAVVRRIGVVRVDVRQDGNGRW